MVCALRLLPEQCLRSIPCHNTIIKSDNSNHKVSCTPKMPADRRLRLPVLQDEHASYSAKRAAAANAAGKSGVKSDAVKAAMERRVAAQQAAADKAARKGRR